jgi:flagellar L-ring protein precursor FlgH
VKLIASLVSLMAISTLLGGCAAVDPVPVPPPRFAAVQPPEVNVPRGPTGSIYNAVQSDNMFGRGRNFQVGDVITVLLDERTQGSRSTSTNVSREAKNNIVPPSVATRLGNIKGIPTGLNLNESSNTSTGTGTADQTATLSGSLAVSVVEVLPNGNLVVRGEKQLSLSEGSEVIQVSGVIRPADVSPNNTVLSRRLAHSQIAYRGSGDLAAASSPGWGTKLLNRVWPF